MNFMFEWQEKYFTSNILMTAFLTIFRRFPTTFRRFPKILQNLSEGDTKIFRKIPKITVDCRKLSRKTRRCFDNTPANLRTVPTFVSAHTFCVTRKAWFKRHARAEVDIDAINYATKYTTKMKAKFSYCDQIKFNEPVLEPGTRK